MITDGGVRQLTHEDLDWVLDIGAERRARILSHAPTFWRPAGEARASHARFLGRQIDQPEVVSLRTAHGFAFGAPRGDLLVVDDLALDDEVRWSTDGEMLLRAAGEHGDLRFVCPVPELARTEAAVRLGMSNVESWWHRDLAPQASVAPREDPTVSVDGASGRLIPAPPVYAPGGPVLLVLQVADASALTAIELEAATAGATVSVVTQRPANSDLAKLLTEAGYVRTTDFFEWRPAR